MDLPTGSRVLELGPGWGNTTLALAQMGHHVTAIDIDPGFCELVGTSMPVGPASRSMSAKATSRRDTLESTFDAVLFFESFHHSSDHLGLLKQLDRIVAPGGRRWSSRPSRSRTRCRPPGA